MKEIVRTTNVSKGIVTTDRVKQHGEVYTPDNIVMDMMKLCQDCYEKDSNFDIKSKDSIIKYIDTTWLEPSCGNGNFLVRILDLKIRLINILLENNFITNVDRMYWLLRAASRIYGIDIIGTNIENSINRMLELIFYGETGILFKDNNYSPRFYSMDESGNIDNKKTFNEFINNKEFRESLESILYHNIQLGNTLTCEAWALDGGKTKLKELYVLDYKYDSTGNGLNIEKQPFKNLTDNSTRELTTHRIDNIFNISDYTDELRVMTATENISNDQFDSDNMDF